jgi:hypothetical protein
MPEKKDHVRSGRENNIKMDLREIGWGGMDWIHLALVNTVMNFQASYNAEKILKKLSDWRPRKDSAPWIWFDFIQIREAVLDIEHAEGTLTTTSPACLCAQAC